MGCGCERVVSSESKKPEERERGQVQTCHIVSAASRHAATTPSPCRHPLCHGQIESERITVGLKTVAIHVYVDWIVVAAGCIWLDHCAVSTNQRSVLTHRDDDQMCIVLQGDVNVLLELDDTIFEHAGVGSTSEIDFGSGRPFTTTCTQSRWRSSTVDCTFTCRAMLPFARASSPGPFPLRCGGGQ